MFVAVLDPFEEVLCLGLVFEKESDGEVLDLEAVEEESVLGILEVDPELLVPEHALVADHVDKLEKECVSDEVVDKHDGSHEPRPRPLLEVWIVHVEPDDGSIDDFVGRLRNDPLDLVLVCGRECCHPEEFVLLAVAGLLLRRANCCFCHCSRLCCHLPKEPSHAEHASKESPVWARRPGEEKERSFPIWRRERGRRSPLQGEMSVFSGKVAGEMETGDYSTSGIQTSSSKYVRKTGRKG